MDDLNGKIALVTGASRGIGRDIALALAQAGADVVVNYRASVEAGHSLRDHILALGRRAVAIQADVSSAPDVASLIRATTEQLGPPDILVNNAGIARVQRPGEIHEDDWDYVLNQNLKLIFYS